MILWSWGLFQKATVRSVIVLQFFLLLSKLFSGLCCFSRLTLAFLFRKWINTSVVFVFRWWSFFLDVSQIRLFRGELQWIIASENITDDLPNSGGLWDCSPAVGWFITELRWSTLAEFTHAPSFEYPKSDGGQYPGHHFVRNVFRPVDSRGVKLGVRCSRKGNEKALKWQMWDKTLPTLENSALICDRYRYLYTATFTRPFTISLLKKSISWTLTIQCLNFLWWTTEGMRAKVLRLAKLADFLGIFSQ